MWSVAAIVPRETPLMEAGTFPGWAPPRLCSAVRRKMGDGGHLCPSASSARDICPAVVCSIIVAPALTAVGGRPTRRSVALVVLESDQPVETVPVDDLPIGCAPWPSLQVIHDPGTFGQPGEPVAHGRGHGSR